jgi:transposase
MRHNGLMSTTQFHQALIDEQPTVWTVPDALWFRLEPVLAAPFDRPKKKSGRPRAPDRPIFDALIYLARTGGQWAALPNTFPPKSTVHDRLKTWVAHGAFQQVWAIVLLEYDEFVGIEWGWQSADGCQVKAPLGKRGIGASRKTRALTQPTELRRAASVTF